MGCTALAEKRLTGTARKLRREMTDAERVLWSHLRGGQMGVKFTRQFPVGGHVVDFACRSLRIVIECDGGQHSVEADAARSAALCGGLDGPKPVPALPTVRTRKLWNSPPPEETSRTFF